MSSKSTKKKRIGSRRAAPNATVTSDETHVTDAVAQHHVLEEGSESINVLSNPDDSKPETQQPPSPDVTMNRKKLGSSRRNKGRQFAKDSEPFLEPREEVEEKTQSNKTVETTQTSLAAQLDRQEESSQGSVQDTSATAKSSWSSGNTPDYDYSEVKSHNMLNFDVMGIVVPNTGNLQADQACENETKLERTDKPDSAQMNPNAHVVPELAHLSAPSSLSADQQLINIQPSNSSEMPEEEPSHVFSVAAMGSNKSDDADLFGQDGSWQGNTLESESQVTSVALESITDKSSPEENTAIKGSVEQAGFLLAKEELPTNKHLQELFGLSADYQLSEDAVNKGHGEDFQQIDYSPQSLTVDATENADTSSGKLKDQTELRDTNQSDDKQDEHPTTADNLEADFKVVSDESVGATLEGSDKGAPQSEGVPETIEIVSTGPSEVMMESMDDSTPKQEASNPDNKQDEPPTKQDNLEALEQSSEDNPSYDTKTPLISGIEEVDTALVQVEDDIKPRAEQMFHQETEQLFSVMEDSKSSSQSFKLEPNVGFDSQPHDNPASIDEATGFQQSGIRRKLGSSRRNKGRQHVKESNEEVLGDTTTDEALEITKMSLATETTSWEDFKPDLIPSVLHDSSMFSMSTPGFSLEVQKPAASNHPEAVRVEKATDPSQKDELPLNMELLPDVWGAQRSHKAVKKDIQPAQIQDEQQNDYSPQSLTVDATENADTSSGNLKDQTELRDTNQSEVSVTVMDDSAPKEEVPNPVSKQEEPPTQDRDLDSDVYDSKQPLIKITEREDDELGQTNEGEGQVDIKHKDDEGVLSEADTSTFSPQTLPSEIDAPSDSNLQDTSVSVDEETNTGFDFSGNRRKLGSSRRNKGRQRVKEPNEDVLGDTTTDEVLEITKMSLATETTSWEDLSQGTKPDLIPSVLHDSSMFSMSTPDFSLEVEKPAASNHPEADLGSLIPKSENLQEDDKETDFKVVSDESVGETPEGSDKGAPQSEGVSETIEILSTHPSEVMMESTDDSTPKQEASNPDDKQDEPPTKQDNLEALEQSSDDNPSKMPLIGGIEEVDTAVVQVEDDIKPRAEQMFHQETEQLVSVMEDSKSSLLSFKLEPNVGFDSQPHDNPASIDEETGFQQSGIRRKLGSSRRNKGKQRVKDDQPTEDADGREPSETTETPLTTETADQTMLEGTNKSYTPQNEEQNSHTDTHACTSELTTSEKHSIPTVDQQVIDLSRCTQMPDEKLLDVSSVTDAESKERDGARHSEDAVKMLHEQEIRLPQMPEMPQTDNTSGGVIDDATESTKIFSEASVDRAEIRDTNQSVLAVKSTDDATKDIMFEVSGQGNEADHVHDTEKPQLSDTERLNTAQADVYEIEGQEKDDLKAGTRKTGPQEAGLFSEMEDSESSSQSLQHEPHAAFDSQPEQNNTSFNSGGNTSKLGSSQEKSMETMLEGTDKSDSPQIKDAVHVKQNEHFGPLAGISEFSSSSLHSSPAADGQLVESIPSERPDEGLPSVSSVAENKESDENTELFRQDGRSWGNDLFSESHVEAENAEYPTTTEITAEESSSREHTEVESSVEQSPKKELAASGEQNENFNPFEVTGAKQSEDVVNKEHEELINPKQVQELLQIDTEPQTLPSEINAPLDSQSQDNPQSIKDETLTAPNPIGSRRKLGSSRRHKGRQQAKEEALENTRADEASTTPNMSLASETARQEELTGLKSPEKIRKTSAVNDDEKLPEKDTSLTDSSAVVTADMSSRSDDDFLQSNKDVDDKEEKPVKETENLSHLTGHDTVKMDLMQPTQASVWKDISHHDDSENARPSTVDTSAQEEASQLKNTEDAVGQDVDVQQTNDAIETVGAESSVDKQAKGEAAEKSEDSTNKVDALQEMNPSHELVSEPVGDVESGISTAMDAPKSQEEKTQSDHSKNLQVKSDQKRRKMGSTRRSQLNRKQEGESDNKGETTESEANAQVDVRNLDETQDVKELVLTAEVSQNEDAPTLLGAFYKKPKEGEESGSAHDEGHRPGSSSNVIPGREGLIAPEPSASRSEEAVDPDGKDGERNVDVHVEPSSAETQITPVIAGRDRRSLDQLLPLNTETTAHTGTTGGSSALGVTTESTRNDDERPQSATPDQESKEQKPNAVIEEVQIPEMKNASPNLTPTSRRRKMGSTRRNLGSRTKEEGSRQKQDEDNEATETEIIAGGIKTVPGIKETELQLHTEHKEGDPEHQRLLETVEHSQVGESQSAPPAQQTVEENPVSQGQLLEAEQLTPSYLPSTSPKKDATSASGSRRRKMGSHRKSRGLQGYGDQSEEREGGLDAQNETDVGNIAEEGGVKASGEESAGLRRISEVDDKKPTSDVIISKVGEPPRPASEKTPFQPPRAEAHLGREQFSLAGEPRAAGLRSASYHVVMIGDSSVGKTSFMKRAQTGKFSLDIPASIGLDSCMWTVVVDGKPVVLEIWDTAGQERFRSITRHVFHRAQAFLLMYDITCTESFSAVSYWANCIQESAAEDVTVLLLGNKSDCAKRQVQTEQGEILAKEYRFEFMECSAATGENVVQSLETVARMLNQRIGTTEEAAALQQQAAPRKTSTCC